MRSRNRQERVLARAAGLGFVAGLRSTMPIAMIAATGGWRAPAGWLERSPRGGLLRWVVPAAAVGEILADKHPRMPARVRLPSVLFRVLSGALAGSVVGAASKRTAGGALAGAVAALLGTFVGYRARTLAARRTPIADPFWGAIEDALAVTVGWRALRQRA